MSTITTAIGNFGVISISSTNQYMSQTQDVIQYIDFSFKILGIDLDFSKFQEMTESERKSFLRDTKINKII